jgi:O-antigen ligase
MFNKAAEKTTALLLLIGAPFATVFLITETVTDPVNATKLAVSGALAFALIFIALTFNLKGLFAYHRTFLIFGVLFLLFSVSAVLGSNSPVSQNLYGSFGRNTGFVTYLVLLLISISALTLTERSSFQRIIWGLQIAGVINVLYCLWVIAFGDFIGWNNPYGNILGLFGNPNFISAFLGMFITTVLALVAAPTTSWTVRAIGLAISAVAFYEIVDSSAIQGIVVTGGGIAIIGFFAVRSYLKSKVITGIYALSVTGVGILAILGALQKGPFTFIYKTSVSLRGAYWNAGITMGMDNPVNGIGMDAYGDWYRRARSEEAATVMPGPKTITNAAHNVVIDIFAYGGFPLLIAYLAMLVMAAIAIIKVVRRMQGYDAVFVAMAAAWICYQTQSLISINQVGLALWGWVLTGALIAYERATRGGANEESAITVKGVKAKTKSSTGVVSPQLVAGIGAVVGILIAVPPMAADTKWRSALNSKDVAQVMATLEPGYLNPSDSQRFAQAVQLLASSNLPEQAHDIAIKGITYNPEYFDAWKVLYFLPNSTDAEKAQALSNMKRLDPRNPDVLDQ